MQIYNYCPICSEVLEPGEFEGRARLHCAACGWINYCNPLPVASCLVMNSERELLLIKRGIEPCKGQWALPGGFIELEESPREAAERELFEETGVKGKAKSLIGVYNQKSEMYGYVLMIGVEFEIENGDITIGDDAEDAKFFPVDNLPEIPFIGNKKLIEDFLRLKM